MVYSFRVPIKALASNKLAQSSGPNPMDVDEVEEWYEEEDYEVELIVASTQCHMCKCYGRLTNNCGSPPAQKGGAEGGKDGNGRASGGHSTASQGKGKGKSKRGKPKSKGGGKRFQTACWTCGEFGHSQNNCPSWKGATAMQMDNVKYEETVRWNRQGLLER